MNVDSEKGIEQDVCVEGFFQPQRFELGNRFSRSDIEIFFLSLFDKLLCVLYQLLQLLAAELQRFG